MGFRNLRNFNLAFLGKQGWRLATRPNSLVAKIFKARYYPNGTFFNAELGNSPSYVWRSIWEAKSVVRKGVRWCIGDGNSITVLGEPWLPDTTDPFVRSDNQALQQEMVCNLMKVGETTGWDEDVLKDVMNDRDRELIIQIPLSANQQSDRLVWSNEKPGIYSVKSAYHLIQMATQGYRDETNKSFWKCLWNLKVPPKMTNLIWRTGSRCLPIRCHLLIKRVVIDATCPMCGIEDETTLHCLVTCREIQEYWNRVGDRY